MNSLSKFSLAVAFSTALFCLLMLSKGFAATGGRSEQYVFMAQDRGGKIVLSMELQRKPHAEPKHQLRLFTEREGWVKLKSDPAPLHPTQVGAPSGSRLEGGFPGKLRYNSPENKLSFQLEANRVGLRKQGYVLADGKGQLDWNGRKLEGMVWMRALPAQDEGFVEKALGAKPHTWRESISLAILPGGTLHLYRQSLSSTLPEAQIGGHFLSDSLSGALEQIDMKATAWRKIGIYKLPFAWQGSFFVEGKRILFRITTERLDNAPNLIIKGRRMGLARGFVKMDGVSHAAFGLAEVEHFMKSQKKIREFEVEHVPAAEPKRGMSWETAKKTF